MSVISDLQDLDNALRALENQASASGDNASASVLLNVISNVENALTIAGAQDILATLPSDSDGAKIKSAIDGIGKAAQDIANQVKSINQSVDLGSNIATLILQAASGQIPAALATAVHLASIN